MLNRQSQIIQTQICDWKQYPKLRNFNEEDSLF